MATGNKNLSVYNKKTIPSAMGMVFALVQADWNDEITDALTKGVLETLIDNGAVKKDILHVKVPGSFELPSGAQFLFENNKKINAVIVIGCVIQGETKHFDFVSQAVSQGIKDVALLYKKPVIFCVLTDNTIKQSRERSGGKHGNKGVESALAAIKMAHLQKVLSK